MIKIKLLLAKIIFGLQTFYYALKANIYRKLNKGNFVFFVLTPQHHNYGDHALAFSGSQILKNYYTFEITGDLLSRFINYPRLLKFLFGKETIVFQGGGYLGTFWFNYGELLLRKMLKEFSSNKIIVFPQSIYYSDDEFGRIELENSKRIYSNCSNLILAARDKISYKMMNEYYPNNTVILIPDLVLYLNKCKDNCVRNGCMITLRNDIEKEIDDDLKKNIIKFAEDNFTEVKYVDMLSKSRITPKKRERELEVHFERFRSSQLVITDRLHGMIFSAITGTPCVVLKSKSHKVKGIYDWIFSNCEYITFTDNTDAIKKFYKEVVKIPGGGYNYLYDNSSIMPYYDELKLLIKQFVSGK